MVSRYLDSKPEAPIPYDSMPYEASIPRSKIKVKF